MCQISHSHKMHSRPAEDSHTQKRWLEFLWGYSNQRSTSKKKQIKFTINNAKEILMYKATCCVACCSIKISLLSIMHQQSAWSLRRNCLETILNVNDELRLYFILVLLSSIVQVCKLNITNACLCCLSSRLSTYSIKLNQYSVLLCVLQRLIKKVFRFG